MAKYDFVKMQRKLAKYLDEQRFLHTLGVMYTSASLAMIYGYDIEDAQCAGLLHDSAKCIPNKKKLKLCAQHNIAVSDFEKEHPVLLHAKVGAYIAEEKYGVKDPDILSAITYHTTGKADMTLLEKIIYVADYMEPNRDKAPNLPRVRTLAFQDLDECVYEIMKDTLEYLKDNPNAIDNNTRIACEYYKKLHDEKEANHQ